MSTPVPYADLSDAQLLDQFLRVRDEGAFRELARRYWQLVLAVCRRVLSDEHDAADAFQMTFLILARDARRIRKRTSLASWLHGVAYRSSLRIARQRRTRRETTLPVGLAVDNGELTEINRRHNERLLDEELRGLPESYRVPLVLHHLMGKSRQEVADQLKISVTTLKGRLQRGRQTLRMRLAMRGVQLSLALTLVERSIHVTKAACVDIYVASAVNAANGVTSPGTMTIANTLNNACGGTMMNVTRSTLAASLAVAVLAAVVLLGAQSRPAVEADAAELYLSPVETTGHNSTVLLLAQAETQSKSAAASKSDDGKPVLLLKYGDGKADGKKSIGGNGEMIHFELPDKKQKVRALRIHAARYGTAKAPDEDVDITFVSDDEADIIDNQTVPYARFRRGQSRWVTLKFKEPIEVPEKFWVIFDFGAEQTKGVYVSYDAETGGKHSRVGLPGADSTKVNFEGDWMVQVMLTKPE